MTKLVHLEAFLLLSITIVYVVLAPFSKVEESFNMQATHDLLYKSWRNIASFDHMYFPGVVPRTFIGPLVISTLSYMPKAIFHLSSFATLHLIRIILGILTTISLLIIRNSLTNRFTQSTGTWYTLITASQFHLLFYASRTLPNVFALILTNLAFAYRLRSTCNHAAYNAIILLSIACALFRSELCLYIFTTLLMELATKRIQFIPTIIKGGCAAVVTAILSILVDSYFWHRPSYPELEVFYFNVVLNKSSAWGTEPFHWYFTNALPRALGGSYLLAMLAVISQRRLLLSLVMPVVGFVMIYSVLPHKELRFIFYALPVLNVAAAVAADSAYRGLKGQMDVIFANWRGRETEIVKVQRRRLICDAVVFMLVVATLAASTLQTIVSVSASRANYPSGVAMRKMHEIEGRLYSQSGMCGEARVHIDVDSAMNGITQFVYEHGSKCAQWKYSKEEDVGKIEWSSFTHLISAQGSHEGFCVIHAQPSFAGIDLRRGRIRLEPHTFVLRNVNVSSVGCANWKRR